MNDLPSGEFGVSEKAMRQACRSAEKRQAHRKEGRAENMFLSHKTANESRKSLNAIERCYSPQEIARLLSVSVQTVHRRIKSREIAPVFSLSKRDIRIPASSLNRFLSSIKL